MVSAQTTYGGCIATGRVSRVAFHAVILLLICCGCERAAYYRPRALAPGTRAVWCVLRAGDSTRGQMVPLFVNECGPHKAAVSLRQFNMAVTVTAAIRNDEPIMVWIEPGAFRIGVPGGGAALAVGPLKVARRSRGIVDAYRGCSEIREWIDSDRVTIAPGECAVVRASAFIPGNRIPSELDLRIAPCRAKGKLPPALYFTFRRPSVWRMLWDGIAKGP